MKQNAKACAVKHLQNRESGTLKMDSESESHICFDFAGSNGYLLYLCLVHQV